MLRQLRDYHALHPHAVVLYAGDIFDHWNAKAELVNFAIDSLPKGLAIPGQHDLPHHNITEMHRTGYGALVRAGVLRDIQEHTLLGETWGPAITPFPWGVEITPAPDTPAGVVHIALAHRYIWQEGCGYPGAPDTHRLGAYRQALAGYTIAAFGDNHTPFTGNAAGCVVRNGGAFILRKAPERHQVATMGVVFSDGTLKKKTIEPDPADVWEDVADSGTVAPPEGLADYLREMKHLAEDRPEFLDALGRYVDQNKLASGAAALLQATIEKHRGDV